MRTAFFSTVLGVSVVLGLLTTHCSTPTQGADTGATCPPSSTLTYANFGQPFMDKYCVSCHAGKERPRLDSAALVKREVRGIMSTTAAGPSGENDSMPQDADVPLEERKKLGEWLACGAP